MTTDLVQFGTNAVVLRNERTKMTGARLMTCKEYKLANGVKGNEAKKGYSEYLMKNGVNCNARLAEAIAKGEIVTTSFKRWETKGKFQVAGMTSAAALKVGEVKPGKADKAKADQADVALKAAQAEAEELRKELAAMKALAAAE